MFGFGRRGRGSAAEPIAEADAGDEEDVVSRGPFDSEEEPSDQVERLDLGSVRLPVPEGSQLQVEVDPAGPVRAVHLVTQVGRLTVSAFAAPKTSELWPDISRELTEQLRKDGARVHSEDGAWGTELVADSQGAALRFVGVDGPRWMLRGVAAGPPEQAEPRTELLYALIDETVVVRGEDPLPVRTPLPIELPDEIANHIQQVQAESGNQG